MADHTISIDVIGNNLQQTVSLLKEVRDTMNELKRQSAVELKVDTDKLARRINAMRQDMARYAEAFAGMGENIGSSFDSISNQIDNINRKEVRPHVDASELEEAASGAERLASGLTAAASIASSLSSIFSGIGNFSGMFADSFSAMSSMFKFDAVGTASRYLTAMATRAVTGQISGIIERYDIMNTFVPYMELAGVDATTAQTSLNRVDQSIRGIPIGLDEAAFRLRKYQMYMNDIDRATNFTIGIQKAIMAGGASEQMKTTAYTQIDRLLATGKLGQSRQWLSLFNGLGVSLRFLREELALDPTADLKQIAGDLANGTIATDDFLAAIERLADNKGLDQALEIYKSTIEAWRSNIDNAIKRGGQNMLNSVNGVLEDVYGQGITGFMKNVRDGIDTVAGEASTYIRENPQNVRTIGDAIGELLQRAMSLDGDRFINNIITNVSGLARAIGTIFDSFPPGFLEDFTAFATTWAGPLATVMKAAQSGIGVVFGVFERMKDFNMETLISKITGEIERMATAVSTLLGFIPDGLLGDLMAFGLVWGKPVASVLNGISGALRNIAGAIGPGVSFAGANGFFGQLAWLVANQPVIVGVVAAIAAAAGAIYKINKDYKEWQAGVLDEQGYTGMIENIDQLVEKSDTLRDSLETSTKAYREEVSGIRQNAEEASELLQVILDTNEEIDKRINNEQDYDELYSSQLENIEKLRMLMPELSNLLSLDTEGRLENVAALQEQGDAYIELAKKQAEANAMRTQLENAYNTKWEAEAHLSDLQQQQRDLVQSYKDAQATVKRLTEGDAFSTLTPKQYEELMAAGVVIGSYSEKWTELWGAIEETARTIGLTDEQINNMAQQLGTIDKEASDMEKSGVVSKIMEAIKNAASDANGELSKSEQHIDDMVEEYHELREEARSAMQSAIGGLEAIDNTVQPVALSTTTANVSSNNEVGSYFQERLQQVHDWIDKNIKEYGPEWAEQNQEAIQQIIGAAQSDFGDRGLLYGLADAILGDDPTEVQEYLSEYLENSGIKQAVGDLYADIEMMFKHPEDWSTYRDENADEEEFTWMQGFIDEVEAVAASLGPDGDAGSAIVDAANETMDGVTKSLEPISEGFDTATDAAHVFEAAVTNAASVASGKAGEMDSLSTSLGMVASAATHAFTQVSALAAAISRLQDKTVNIRVNVSAGLGRLAHGGMAGYFASGGNVLEGFPGMASGTDTIPAWLTPGEYVIRRSAVGMFGSRLMDRINKMDIGGAFDALMTRISNPMLHGNTYNRDNHATVNNYFYGDNGQNYSQRKAYRYVGSL